MGRNDSQPINGSWGLLVSICAWVIPSVIYLVLRIQFGQDDIWPQVGPLLRTAFEILSVFGQLGALLLAALAWPGKYAKWTVGVASVLFCYHLFMLITAFRSLSAAQIG